MSDYAIKLEKVYKSFEKNKQSIINKIRHTNNKSTSKFYAIKDLSIEINKGETVAVIGLNGSGKSTLLKLIAGIYQPDSGSIDVNGKIGPLLQMGPGFQKELPAKLVQFLRKKYPQLDHSGCSVCPVLVVFKDRFTSERTTQSIKFYHRLIGQKKIR